MKKLGCELGNHTYDHKDLATLSSDEISSEIARVDEQLVNLTGEGASVVRPPYGSVNDTVKSTVGTPMILWSIDTLDWKTQDVESTVEEVMNNVKDGSIISDARYLQHLCRCSRDPDPAAYRRRLSACNSARTGFPASDRIIDRSYIR